MSNTPPRINELAHGRLLMLLLVSVCFPVICIAFLSTMWSSLDEKTHLVVIVVCALSGVMSLALITRLLFCRVHINETGVDADDLFGSSALSWGDIRTAAIVRLNINGQKSSPSIVLSTREPQEVLTYRALTTRKVLSPEEVIRIPMSPRRRAAVEFYLHMTLPEFTL